MIRILRCTKCQTEIKENQKYTAKCGHSYCNKCIDQFTAEGGSNCFEKQCQYFLNIGDLMNRQFSKLTNSNQMVFGKQMHVIQVDQKKQQKQNTMMNHQSPALKSSPKPNVRYQIQQTNNNNQQKTKSKSQAQKSQNNNIPQTSSAKTIKQKQSNTTIFQGNLQQQQKQNQQNTKTNQQELQKINEIIQEEQMTESIKYKCDYCQINDQGLFHNDICNHRLCYDCIQKYYDDYCVCFVKDCGWQINQEQLNEFKLTYVTYQLAEQQELKLKRQQSSSDQQDILISKFQFEEITMQYMNINNMNEFIKIFDELKIANKNYYDMQFPPTQKSLGQNNDQIKWERVSKIFQGDYQFFSKSQDNKRFGLGKWIGPQDIIQGSLGNCYLLASISALGNRRPDLLLDIFITRAINEQGIYCVRLCIDGIWKAIFVDDYFPVYSNLFPVFTKAKNNAIWVMILEKAWAKLFGSYQNSASGSMQEVLRALTGAPTEVIWTQSPNFLEQLRKCLANKVIMVAATQSSDQQPITQGLIPNHAYSILKIKSIIHPKRGQVELLKLRNPWGRNEWTGDWGYNSDLWTQQLRTEFKIDQEDSGVFYMDVSSFMQQFRDIHICYVQPNYYYNSCLNKTKKNKSVYYSVQINTNGDYYFSINQRNQRFLQNPKYSNAKLLICKKDNQNSYSYIAGKISMFGEVWCKCTLTKGEYIIVAKVIWNEKQEFFFSLSCYGQEKVEFKQINKIQDLLSSVFIKKGQLQQPKRTYDNMGQPNIQSCYNLDRLDGWGYYFIDNQSKVKLSSKINFNKFYGLKFCKPHRGVTLHVELMPGKQFIAIIKVHQGYEIEFTQKVMFT